MKRKEIRALHGKTLAELAKELEVKQTDLNKILREIPVKRPKNTRILRGLRDDIARIQTILAEVQIAKPKEK